MIRLLSSIRRDTRGTSVVELAFALPVLCVLALAGVDFALAFSKKLEVQQYAQAGADFVVANGDTAPTPSAVRDEIVALSGLPADKITITQFTECNKVRVVTFGACPIGVPNQVDYMQIRVAKEFQPVVQVNGISDFMSTRDLTGSVVVRLP